MTEPNDEPAPPTGAPSPPADDPTAASPLPPEPPAAMVSVEPTVPAEPGVPAAPGLSATPEPPASDVPATEVPAAPVWIPPDGSDGGGRRRGCCLILAVVGAGVAVLAVIAIIGLIFLGGQIRALQGTVKYETGTSTASSDCFVKEAATTFPASASIHFVATFTRPVTADEKVTVIVTLPDGTTRTTDDAYQGGGICISDTLDPGLDTGSWALEFKVGTEVLASGGFTVTP
jgi:hypothetical protein